MLLRCPHRYGMKVCGVKKQVLPAAERSRADAYKAISIEIGSLFRVKIHSSTAIFRQP
jgi:hypothetical protein